ncbi:hypothetical protein MUGA111182_08800 [Mucilaginibacter galii]|uniref:Lipoprotein n=1 Tax=Mucilaginibacter galii TaxID=2005073 RepID=A0A917MZX3_9SPHI|nr:hypothetical protein [Mucilaginibacter galii]GGI49476.1 hypothetical protein GCM10011425_06880 [Mucilaginibacter galii]
MILKTVTGVLLAMVLFGCNKGSATATDLPDFVIYLQMPSVTGETLSVYYTDPSSANLVSLKIKSVAGQQGDYSDEVPSGNFVSKYLFEVCQKKGVRNFIVRFHRNGLTEDHQLFINFQSIPSGGFNIPDASIDGKALTKLPDSDYNTNAHYSTGFKYER